ncbi:serine hydroxymethyltransferase [Patescibacteria group bacterium]|jgi:glycine hydroxymethyltransferase|nr:serine hydroxymethyltransferase [Patescibacteria group bacterium]
MFKALPQADAEIAGLIEEEIARQRTGLELIASENYVSQAVLEAMGTPLTNKYSEGYPGKRYYGGNETIDKIETLAIERAKQLFGAEHANVQSHAGAQANFAVYLALLNPGDTVLAMDLAHGGHLTHGSPVNFSGKWFKIIPYGVSKTDELVDMEEVARLAREHKPKMIIAGFSAYPRKLDFAKFAEIAKEVGAYLFVDMAHVAGLVAAKLYPDPIPHADVVTTTTHKTLRGPRGAMILCKKEDRLDPGGKKNLAQKIDSAVFPGAQGGPLEHIIAAKAVAFHEALQPGFADYQKQVLKNAQAMAEAFITEGGRIVSGGTDNHLMLLDVTPWGVGGKEAEQWLEAVGISANKNMVPFDERKPADPSGVRLGTPAITTRGFDETASKEVALLIAKLLKSKNDPAVAVEVKQKVRDLADAHPLYPNL